MELKESKFFDMAAIIAAGVMANPANANLLNDQYGQQQALTNVFNALTQTIMQSGCAIVPDNGNS